MNADWEPGGLLLLAWAQVRIALVACPADDCLTRPIMTKALYAARDALNAAWQKAIKEESKEYEQTSPYFNIAVRNFRAQAAAVTGPQGDQVRKCIEVAERARK